MSGFSSSLFVEEPSQDFECSICLQILNDPRQCPDNGHMFCNKCILSHLQFRQVCPECRCQLSHTNLQEIKAVKRMIGKKKIKCPTTEGLKQNEDGEHCCWVGSIDDHREHLDRLCGFVVVQCDNSPCIYTTSRRHMKAHDDACTHKIISCVHCGAKNARTVQSQHDGICARKPMQCPRECGEAFPRFQLENHLSQCLLVEIYCPHYSTFGCCSVCPGRIIRRDLASHLADPKTMAAVINHLTEHVTRLNQQAAEDKITIEALKRQLGEASPSGEIATKIAANFPRTFSIPCGDARATCETSGAFFVYDLTSNSVSGVVPASITSQWSVAPCHESKALLVQQMKKQNVLEGVTCTVHHIAHEFQNPDFSDSSQPFENISTPAHLGHGVQVYIRVYRRVVGGVFGCSVRIDGFRGEGEVTVTSFRFGRGAPRQQSRSSTWTCDKECGWACFFTKAQLATEGWITEDNKVRLLVSLQLGENILVRNQSIIAEYPHITAQWSSPPCRWSLQALAAQLEKRVSITGERWTTHHIAHEFRSADFTDSNASIEVYSPKADLGDRIHGRILVRRTAAAAAGAGAGGLECLAQLDGFTGMAELAITVFRFDAGAPKQKEFIHSWGSRGGGGEGSWGGMFFRRDAQLVQEGWVTEGNKLRLLLTVHLRRQH